MANSYTPPDRSSYDPGWNDPPPMPSMAPQAPAAGKPRNSLNKRVAFPMQSSGTMSSNVKTTAEGLPLPFSTAKYQPPPMTAAPIPETNSTSQIMLPPPPMTTLNPSNQLQTATTETVGEDFDPVSAKEFTNSIFARLVDGLTTDASKLSEIRKRLEILDQMWQENKLNEAAQKNLYQLAKALENKDAAAAMEKHRLLATQHISISTQWATALRQLILSISHESELKSQNSPAVLHETDVVQFVDVGTKPIVMDNIPTIPQEQTDPNPLPGNDAIPLANQVQPNSENTSKSKFGRILHI